MRPSAPGPWQWTWGSMSFWWRPPESRPPSFWGWLGSVLFAFLTNKYFVFRAGHEGPGAFFRELGEFTLGRLLSMVLEVMGVDILVRRGFDRPLLGVTGGRAKVLITLLVILVNYLISKFLVFREVQS